MKYEIAFIDREHIRDGKLPVGLLSRKGLEIHLVEPNKPFATHAGSKLILTKDDKLESVKKIARG